VRMADILNRNVMNLVLIRSPLNLHVVALDVSYICDLLGLDKEWEYIGRAEPELRVEVLVQVGV